MPALPSMQIRSSFFSQFNITHCFSEIILCVALILFFFLFFFYQCYCSICGSVRMSTDRNLLGVKQFLFQVSPPLSLSFLQQSVQWRPCLPSCLRCYRNGCVLSACFNHQPHLLNRSSCHDSLTSIDTGIIKVVSLLIYKDMNRIRL